ncbi:MAG TPA: AAA domain-containing protein [Candidatus Dormibacteraeota bacterium]|nr:AAA domain-containing protein [Candidatus Dormibacteraeota bacterium]
MESGAGSEAERVSRSVIDPQTAATEGRERARPVVKVLWHVLEDVVLNSGQGTTRDRILEPLGRVLLVFRNAAQMAQNDIASIIALYTDSADDQSPIRASTAAVDAWQTLLRDGTSPLFLTRLQPDLALAPDDRLDDGERKQIESWLHGAYKIERRCPIRLMGYPVDTLRNVLHAYVGAKVDGDESDRVMIRTFQLRSPDDYTATLMKAMWERERRAIATLSLTPAGRALVQYREDRWLESENIALLVTDWPGVTTLRDVLRQNLVGTVRAERGRRSFWNQFLPLLEGVHALHRAGFLHRAISPDAIYHSEVDGSNKDTWTLRLGHFEWSVYLRRLDGLGPYKRRELNRYLAPEALRAALDILDRFSGETFGSDLYAVGLTLFECLVRPVTVDDELEVYKSRDAYGVKSQDAHRDWLHSLRTEAHRARVEGRIERFEEALLTELLQFDVNRRPPTLEPLIDAIRQANLIERSRFRKPLPVFTTLRCHHESGDPRKDVRNIAFFLRRELPEVDLTTDLSSLSTAGLARILTDDLRGASVFLNRDTEAPLLLQSRSGTFYRLKQFVWDGEPNTKLAFLQVAHQYQGDEPLGESIGVLHASVAVLDIGMGEPKISRIVADYAERGWTDLFEAALSSNAFVETENREREHRLTLLDVLGVSNEVEYALAWKESPFIRAKKGTALICAPPGQENLATTVSAWLARDLWIEVARSREAAGTGLEIGLVMEALDLESGVVDLSSGGVAAEAIPDAGVLRPTGNRGVFAMYRRRKDLLQQIRDDSTLLNSVIAPADVAIELPEKLIGRARFSIARLDDEKKRIIERYRRTRPFLVVQGPPGTGKTTLATEIVLQTLADISNARILITAQGHAPLDNLLVRLMQERERNPDAEKKLQSVEIIRLKSGNRTDLEYPERVRNHLPYERADQLFRALRQESESRKEDRGLDGLVARLVVDALAPYASAPTSLLRRVEESANLVFVTTNAREVEEAVSGSFDVVIVEEAARCVPMELLSVMRLSRHWLLIGDHQQLPPFGYELVMNEVERRISALITDVELRRALKRSDGEAVGRHDRNELEASRLQKLLRATPRYMNLFRHLHESGDAKVSATLRTQWRMHPSIGTMVSDVFYGSDAVVNPDGEELEALIKRTTHPFREPAYLSKSQLVWIDFDPMTVDSACRERRGPGGQLENEAERRTAVAFLRLLRNGRRSHDLAILTPYRKQMEQLRGLMSEQQNVFDAFGSVEDRIFTVDSFQGQQAGTVLLSLVRNNDAVNPQSGVGFLAEAQRATVMFSRAERLLIILGCSAHFRRFAETAWVIDIFSRATVRPWTDFIPAAERSKLDEYRFRST